MNKKLSNVLTKDDRYISDIVEKAIDKKLSSKKITAKDEDAIQNLVDKLVEKKISRITATFEKRIEVLEGQLFEKDEENKKLKDEIKSLNNAMANKQEAAKKAERQTKIDQDETKRRFNDLEQYTRINNLRIYGIEIKMSMKAHRRL